MEKKKRGTYDHSFDNKNEILLVRWKDSSVCTMATNYDNVEPLWKVKRWCKTKKEKTDIQQPNVFQTYNRGMGGVDNNDQGVNKYRIAVRGKKWYWVLFTSMLNVALVNAWKLHQMVSDDKMDLLLFTRNVTRYSYYLRFSTKANVKSRNSSTVPRSIVQDSNRHFPQKLSKQLRCSELFGQLQTSRESALAPDALRRALADTFSDQRRFMLGAMDDAAECFENILGRVHAHLAHKQSEEQCVVQHCVPHRKFAMRLEERAACQRCGATGGGGGEAMTYTQMVHYVSTSTLVYQVRANVTGSPMTFGRLLLKAANMGDVRQCPNSCGAVIQVTRTLTNRPEIVSIGLVWNSERPTLEHIMEVFSTIGTTLRMNDVFTSVVDSRWADTSLHHLVGVVTYYGKHYSTFFFHTKLKVWIYFDDANVREVSTLTAALCSA
nr:unnamed protein product [Callosobruchus analis]